MNQVKLGIIGLGNMGSGHCNNILAGLTPEIKLTAAADLRQSRRDWAKETLPDDVVLFENGDQLIESGLCDAVIIATPHYEHPRLAILAFEHGLHVMSEKPAGVYTKQVREMNEAAIRSGKVFGMMFNQRTNAFTERCMKWYRAANTVKSSASTGSSPTGTAQRLTITPAAGAQPGTAKAAACC